MIMVNRIRRKINKLRFQPIRVFCIHNVSDSFDADSMWPCDWIQTEKFKQTVLELQKRYSFISLVEAQNHLLKDWFRFHRYAVMTADDGFSSMKTIIPWLEKRNIPITLFINPIVWDGKTVGQNLRSLPVNNNVDSGKEIYLQFEDLKNLQSPLVTFGYHGYDHIDEGIESFEAFVSNFEKCKQAMNFLGNVVPFYAHTYGRTKKENDIFLANCGMTPIYINGGHNYTLERYLDRELFRP